jgi:hypothetical protein
MSGMAVYCYVAPQSVAISKVNFLSPIFKRIRFTPHREWKQGSSVSFVTRLLAGRYGIEFPTGTKSFSVFRNDHTGAERHTASYSVGKAARAGISPLTFKCRCSERVELLSVWTWLHTDKFYSAPPQLLIRSARAV